MISCLLLLIMVVTPTYEGTDHTREYVPLLVYGSYLGSNIHLGTRDTFADLAQTIVDIMGVEAGFAGISFADKLFG